MIKIWRTIELYQLKENDENFTWCWLENSYFTSADVSILCYGYGVSQYPQFYVKDLDMYQVLPFPYLWSFDGGLGDKLI